MKKTLKTASVILFFLICLVPLAVMLIGGGETARGNEVLAAEPSLKTEDGAVNTGYLAELSNWFDDRFGLRHELVTLWNGFNVKVFGTSPESGVIAGTDGWLYYADSESDFLGLGVTDAELAAVAENLRLAQAYMDETGKAFVFTAAPDKNSIYPGNMPGRYSKSANRAIPDALKAACEERGVNYADLFTALSAEEETLYFATDSHWNSKGAALGADVILSAAGTESAYFDDTLFELNLTHSGDLYEMLYPTGTETEPDYSYLPGFSHKAIGDTNSGNAITIRTRGGAGEGSLHCWRDSFGVSLYPYLAESFSSATFSRSGTYNFYEAAASDCVVLEIVERNLIRLLGDVFICPSPVCETPQETAPAAELTAAVEPGKAYGIPGYFRVYGSLPCEELPGSIVLNFADCSYGCFISLDEDGSVCFTAWIESGSDLPVSITANGTTYSLVCGCAEGWDEVIAEEPETEVIETEPQEEKPDLYALAGKCIDKPVEELYAAIGEPESSEYVSSCLGYGYDGELNYGSFIVYTFKSNSGETVRDVFSLEEIGSDGGIEKLDALIQQLLSEITDDSMTQEEKLKAAYNYTVSSFYYLKRSMYEPGEEDWSEREAYIMLTTGYGNCYNYAGAFCELAKALGYNAVVRSGFITHNITPHGWVEITLNGTVYICDPEVEMSAVHNPNMGYKNMFMLDASGDDARIMMYDTTPKTHN